MNITRDFAMTNRMRQLRPRDAVLFVAVAAVVALIGVLAGRELGIGGEAVAIRDRVRSQPAAERMESDLSLTLGAPDFCETAPPLGFIGDRVYLDENDDWIIETISTGWANVAETPVSWSVSGGAPPYTLVIDGEERDANQPYKGPAGTASVSCAMYSSGTFLHENSGERRFREEPLVDSGLKTISATVTDSNGNTATATVGVYVILEVPGSDSVLKSGHTYRVFDHLVTAPDAFDLEVGSVIESTCNPGRHCRTWFSLVIGDTGVEVMVDFDNGAPGGAWYPDSQHNSLSDAARTEQQNKITEAIDQTIASLNRYPNISEPSP